MPPPVCETHGIEKIRRKKGLSPGGVQRFRWICRKCDSLRQRQYAVARRVGPQTRECVECGSTFTSEGRGSSSRKLCGDLACRRARRTRQERASRERNGVYGYQRLRKDSCEVCGWSEEVCDVHHIDGDRTHNALENLVTLCPNHHRVADRALREGYVPAWLAVLKLAS